ncbi:glycerophosphodiester phosphodiesterase [Corynebacterium hadale]|uniref:Glycerophosphodiester phosphodiesterase n=1 Tax=Corynebacterium hadale TaxID=2026255 RepID=A0ABX4HAG2_9CORY|nr:glycerophosphodiester phosphodiesterase [Corynebacterium hadale]
MAIFTAIAQLASMTVSADAVETSPTHSIESVSELRLPLGDAPTPWIAAHRGQWRDFPENSIPGFLAAIRDGANILETDIRRTADGHLVLMHDPTVDRTTNGTGEVADLTLEQIKQLRLRQSLGNGPSAITSYEVPTLDELLDAVKGENVLIDLDKGWDYREQMYEELSARDMLDYGLFQGSPNVPDAVAFMKKHPEAFYMHIIGDDMEDQFEQFGEYTPDMIEIPWSSPEDFQGTDEFWEKVDAKTAVFADSMWNSISGGHTDEASLLDPSTGWGYHLSRGADVIQTDNVKAISAWRNGADVTKSGLRPDSIRVQAEDYVNDPALYSDADSKNECSAPVIHPESPVDACNLDGAKIIQYIRDGEFWALDFDVPTDGVYELSMRQSSDTEPGGVVTVETEDGQKGAVPAPNTTHNRNFSVINLGQFQLQRGTNRITFSFSHPDYMSVDWVQADPVPAGSQAQETLTTIATASAPSAETAVTSVQATTSIPATTGDNEPKTTTVTATPASNTSHESKGSADTSKNVGIFAGGAVFGAIAIVLAIIGGVSAILNNIVDQARELLEI